MQLTKRILVLLIATACLASVEVIGQESIANSRIQKKEFYKSLVIPAALVGTGLLIKSDNGLNIAIRNRRNESVPDFKTHADDYLQYFPIAAVYGLNACGVKGKNNVGNSMAMLIKSELLMLAITQPLKRWTNVVRPDGSTDNSFPSGHTAQAFVAATFLHKEFGDKSIWYSVGAYTCATTIGAMRILNNRHWLSDVLAGAGMGILSTNLVYYTHRYKWSKKSGRTVFMPTYGAGPGLYLRYNFR